MYRVYDKRNDESLYKSFSNIDCLHWVDENFSQRDEEIAYIFIEKIKK